MNIVIVACFTANHRLEHIVNYLKKNNNVTVIKSDFDHITKEKITCKNKDYTYIDTKKYSKNLSFKRIYSHYDFSKKVLKKIQEIKPDIIYALIPPNSLANEIIKYKNKNNDVKVIFDIIDLWPETLPFKKIKTILKLPLFFWKRIRDKNLKKADYVITECDLYQKVLGNRLPSNVTTMHLAEKYIGYDKKIEFDKFEICYLGSINSIIDLDLIVETLNELNKYKKVKLHLIGDGEKRKELTEKLEKAKIKYHYYGKIFDDVEKKTILDKCIFGINFMKDSVCVGLTMKSIEYFKFGMPILNNIKEDTEKIVEKYEIGFNVTKENLEDVVKKISSMSENKLIQKKYAVEKMYKNEFEIEILENKLKDIIKAL